MRSSDLKNLFAGKIDVLSFKKLVGEEVIQYERLHAKKGSSIPIELIENEKLFFGKHEFLFLCESYIVEALNKFEISYITEAILLSTNVEFENGLIEEYLDLFSYLEDDERLSKEDILKMIDEIE